MSKQCHIRTGFALRIPLSIVVFNRSMNHRFGLLFFGERSCRPNRYPIPPPRACPALNPRGRLFLLDQPMGIFKNREPAFLKTPVMHHNPGAVKIGRPGGAVCDPMVTFQCLNRPGSSLPPEFACCSGSWHSKRLMRSDCDWIHPV